MTKERKTLTVDLKGWEDYQGNFNSEQHFIKGQKVLVWTGFNNNNVHWNTAMEYDPKNDDLEQLRKSPSYSDMAGNTTYFAGLRTVTRIFKRKMWVK